MKRVLTATVLIVAVVFLLIRGQLWMITLAAALVATLASWEYRQLANTGAADSRSGIPIWWMLLGIAAVFVVVFYRPSDTIAVVSALGVLLFVRCGFRSPLDRVLPVTSAGVFGLLYVAWPLTLLPLLWEQEGGAALLLLLMVCVWAGDIAALYAGRAIGGPKLAPRLSPGKTWAGSVASIAASVLGAWLLVVIGDLLTARGNAVLHLAAPLWQVLVLAAILNIAAQLGDLLESAIKRGAGVKDSGTLLPGHGGILDRIDALLLAAPVLWFTLLIRDAIIARF